MDLKDTLTEHDCGTLGFPVDSVLSKIEKFPGLSGKLQDLLEAPQVSISPPLGHDPIDGKKNLYLADKPVYVPYITAMIMVRYAKAYTYRECRERLEKAGYKVSSEGQLSNIFNRIETKLGLRDKRRTEKRIADKNRENRENGIKRPATQARKDHLKGARKIQEANAAIKRAERDKQVAMAKLGRQAGKSGLTAKQLRDELSLRTPEARALADRIPKNRKIIYQPNPKQVLFHAAGEKFVLYGGAAGGGKSYAIMMDALRYCMYSDYRALIIRKTSPMLKELIGVSRMFYKKAYPGARFNKQEGVWYFPSGATIQFGYLDREEDLENYQGLPYTYIAFDEIQHQRSPEAFEYLARSRLRTTNPNMECFVRASANPGGAAWVKEFFIDPAGPNTTFWKKGLSWRFIPARLEDNPQLDVPEADGVSAYRKMLMSMDDTRRAQLLDGDWLAGDDNMFAFIPDIHVTSDDPPIHWNRIRGMDYGYRDPAATVWAAISPDNRMVIYDEHESLEETHGPWARDVIAREKKDTGPFGIVAPLEEVIDWSIFNVTGHTGPGVLEIIRKAGMRPRPADRNREAGWNQIHNRLAYDEKGIVSILIHERCERLIEQLTSARIHPKKPDDIDDTRATSKGRKHHWDLLDCLRYTCMARPSTMNFKDRATKYKAKASMSTVWAKFGRAAA